MLLKNEFMEFLREDDICKELFEIIRHGGKPTGNYPRNPATPPVLKIEFIAFLRDADVSKEIFEITRRGGKPLQTLSSVEDVTDNPPDTKEITASLSDKLALLKSKAAKPSSTSASAELNGVKDFTVVKEKICPVCSRKTKVVQCRPKLDAETVDVDFCMHFTNFNAYLYTIFQCEHCGYVADENKFQERMPEKVRRPLKTFLDENDMRTTFVEERTKKDALTLYEMAIYFNKMFEHSPGRQALLYQKMAWICRIEDDYQKEQEYLAKTSELLDESLESEQYPIGKLTNDQASYINAVTSYMLNDFDKALKILYSLVMSRNFKMAQPELYEKSREVLQDIRQVKMSGKKKGY